MRARSPASTRIRRWIAGWGQRAGEDLRRQVVVREAHLTEVDGQPDAGVTEREDQQRPMLGVSVPLIVTARSTGDRTAWVVRGAVRCSTSMWRSAGAARNSPSKTPGGVVGVDVDALQA